MQPTVNSRQRLGKLGLCLLALLGAAIVLFASTGSARGAQVATAWRGANVHSLWATETNQQMNADIDAVKRAGANVVRLDIGWATLDSSGPGQLTPWYSQKLAAFMSYAHQSGIQVVAILFTTPCWASSAPPSVKQNCQGDWWGRGVGWYPPANDQDFADFTRYITSTYGPDLAAVEIWNEPDNPGGAYWTSSNAAGDYAQLLKAAYPAAKAGDSSVPVLAASLAGSDTAFLAQLYQDGIQGSYDGIAVHAYCSTDAPSAAPAGGDRRFEFTAGLQAIHALQLQHGDNTPIWVTEFGWDTVNSSLANQAAFIEQGYQILAGMPYVQAGIVYELHDDLGGAANDPEASFGLLNQDYSPKPAYAAFTTVMTAPGAPGLIAPTAGSVVSGPRPTLAFSAAPGATVAVSIDGRPVGTATANAAGVASITVPTPLADGQHAAYGIQTDVYGNVGPASGVATFTIGPAAPVIVSPGAGTTSKAAMVMEVGGAPGNSVTVCVHGAPCSLVSANAAGTASLTVAGLGSGRHRVRARQTDAQGLISPWSSAVAWTVARSARHKLVGRSSAGSRATVRRRSVLRLRVSPHASPVLAVTCSVPRIAIKRCVVAVYAAGRRVGEGMITVRRPHGGRTVVRVRLNARGRRYEQVSNGRATFTLRGSATLVGGRLVHTSRRVVQGG